MQTNEQGVKDVAFMHISEQGVKDTLRESLQQTVRYSF